MTRCKQAFCGGWCYADRDDGRTVLVCAFCASRTTVGPDERRAAYEADKRLIVVGERLKPGRPPREGRSG